MWDFNGHFAFTDAHKQTQTNAKSLSEGGKRRLMKIMEEFSSFVFIWLSGLFFHYTQFSWEFESVYEIKE